MCVLDDSEFTEAGKFDLKIQLPNMLNSEKASARCTAARRDCTLYREPEGLH